MDRDKLIKRFERYMLNDLGIQYRTCTGYKNSLNSYLDWLQDNDIKPKKVTMQESYGFIAYRQQRGDAQSTVKGYKGIVTHFNHSLGMKANPMLMVHLAKNDRTTPTQLLDEEFLDTIYRETNANTLVQKRDRCMLGMMVFLGLQRKELELLQLNHLDLEEGRLYVPATTISNERWINLHPKQILHLSNYIYDIRPALSKQFRRETNNLFFSSGEATHLNGALNRMITRLKQEFHYIKDFKQLKQSRIVIWVKELGLREAQYLGGYRYVTSVQRYDFKSIDDLQKKLEFHHPMEKMEYK